MKAGSQKLCGYRTIFVSAEHLLYFYAKTAVKSGIGKNRNHADKQLGLEK